MLGFGAGMLDRLARRVQAACAVVPDARDWLHAAALLVLFALLALPLGFQVGFLQVEILRSWRTIARVLLVSLLFPAIAEELLFRVLLLPHPKEEASPAARWLWAAVGWTLFVASHPLKALELFPGRQPVFAGPAFLVLAGLLGLVCTISYLRSGSLWPPAAIHWLAVAAWLLLLGGQRALEG